MRPLPPVLGPIERPARLWVTALADAGGCLLRLCCGSGVDALMLPKHPYAWLGTALHRLRASASRAFLREEEVPSASVGALLEAEWATLRTELARDPGTAHLTNLVAIREDWEAQRRIRLALSDAQAFLKVGPARPAAPDLGGVPPLEALQVARKYLEYPLKSSRLETAGRADCVIRTGPAAWAVSDLKTGHVLDEDGQVASRIALQLQLYALMIRDGRPHAQVQLLVEAGHIYEVPSDGPELEATDAMLAGVRSELRAHGSRPDAAALARPGAQCRRCEFRVGCPAYRASAPTLWAQATRDAEAWSDVAGVLKGVERSPSNRVSVLLQSATGRPVRVAGLSPRHGIDESLVGREVWFFDLQASAREKAGGYPTNFYEIPDTPSEPRAWTATGFVGPH